jgi:hypothetical protein
MAEVMWNKLNSDGRTTDGDVDTGPYLLSIASLGDPSAARKAGLRSDH